MLHMVVEPQADKNNNKNKYTKQKKETSSPGAARTLCLSVTLSCDNHAAPFSESGGSKEDDLLRLEGVFELVLLSGLRTRSSR